MLRLRFDRSPFPGDQALVQQLDERAKASVGISTWKQYWQCGGTMALNQVVDHVPEMSSAETEGG